MMPSSAQSIWRPAGGDLKFGLCINSDVEIAYFHLRYVEEILERRSDVWFDARSKHRPMQRNLAFGTAPYPARRAGVHPLDETAKQRTGLLGS